MPRPAVTKPAYCKACSKITPHYRSGHCAPCARAAAMAYRKAKAAGGTTSYGWTAEHQKWLNHRNVKP